MNTSLSAFHSLLKITLLWSILLFGLCFSTQRALADHGSITVSPLSTDIQLQKGNRYEYKLVVTNVNSEEYEIQVDVSDIVIDSAHNVSFLPDTSKNNRRKSLASWVQVANTGFQLESSASRELNTVIAVPKDIADGDYFASINVAFLPLEDSQAAAGKVKVRQSIGSLLLVRISSEEGISSSLPLSDDYLVSDLKFSSQDEGIQVGLDFSNDTLRYVVLHPLLEIRNESDDIQYSSKGKKQRIFPGESAYVEHVFPAIYLQSIEKLFLTYSLVDDVSGKVYTRKQMQLDTAHEETFLLNDLFVSIGRSVLTGGILVLLLMVLLVWRKKRKKDDGKKRKAKSKGRKANG